MVGLGLYPTNPLSLGVSTATAAAISAITAGPTFTGTASFSGATVTGLTAAEIPTLALNQVTGAISSSALAPYALLAGGNAFTSGTQNFSGSTVTNITNPTFITGITTPLINSATISTTGTTNLVVGSSVTPSAAQSKMTAIGVGALGSVGGATAITLASQVYTVAGTTGSMTVSASASFNLNDGQIIALIISSVTQYYTCKAGTSATSITLTDDNLTTGATSNAAAQALVYSGGGTAVGYNALNAETTGSANTAFGSGVLGLCSTGYSNTSMGFQSGQLLTTGNSNCFYGPYSGQKLTTSGANCCFGYAAGQSLTTGTGQNTFVGTSAGGLCTTGSNNTYVGRVVGYKCTGSNNAMVGAGIAYISSSSASNNSYFGQGIASSGTGGNNVVVGQGAGALTSASNLVLLGQASGANIATAANTVCIGQGSGPASDTSNGVYVGNATISTANTPTAGAGYILSGVGQVWTSTSDARDKADIESAAPEYGLDYVQALRPVTFLADERSNYPSGISDKSLCGTKHICGFLAQEVIAAEQSLSIEFSCVGQSDPEHLTLGTTSMIPMLVLAIQQLVIRVKALEAQITYSA